jgi:DNA-binding CsgD family transcriptional regulator
LSLYAALTDREKWLVKELVQGSNLTDILQKANITENTFRVHRRHLLAKTRKLSLRKNDLCFLLL